MNKHICIAQDGGVGMERCGACEEEERASVRPAVIRQTKPMPQRGSKGEAHWHAKVTEREVKAIRTLKEDYGMTLKGLSDAFNLSRASIADIVYRRSWRHVQ
jgi:hypothetical protein